MDIRQMIQLFRMAAKTSLILLGSTAVLAGDRQHEQPTRPHISAACSPNWGFHQTCWSRFPAVPPCHDSGSCSTSDSYENYPAQQMLYTPQNTQMHDGAQFVSPMYGSQQRPISVFPGGSSPAANVPSGGMFTPSADSTLNVPAQRQFEPTHSPETPPNQGHYSQPTSPVPAPAGGLPPLPTPPMSVPGQSSWQPNLNYDPNPQQMSRFTAPSKQALQSGTRYGIVSRSMKSSSLPMPAPAAMNSGSLTGALVMNIQTQPNMSNPPLSTGRYGSAAVAGGVQTSRVPLAFASQSRVLPNPSGSSASYRSAQAMPPANARVQTAFQPTQLLPVQNYPTMPSEPLRRTP